MKVEIGREQLSVPPGLNDLCVRIGGLNPFHEPNYRLVWGWSQLAWIGPELEPKYFGRLKSRFHLESWRPCPQSPEQWKSIVGPDGIAYPTYGEFLSPAPTLFESVDTREFCYPTSSVVLAAVQEHAHKWRHGQSGGISLRLKMNALEDAQEREAKKQKERLTDIYTEALSPSFQPPMVGYTGSSERVLHA